MKRVCLSLAASLAIAALVACSSSKSSDSPTAPSLPALPGVTVTTLVVTNQPANGNTIQMIATARMSDSSSQTVTTGATWETSNPAIATISSSGLLTVLANGSVDVRAMYQGVLGSLTVPVTRAPDPNARYTLSGIAREVSPEPRILGDVRITITEGPDTGMAASSDAGGQFRFASVAGSRVSLEASRAGYQLWRMTNLTIDGNKQIEVVMFPIPPVNAAGEMATGRCKDSSWTWETSVLNACSAHGGLAYGVCPGPMCGAPISGVR
jgi:hypothetical protein